MSTTLRDICCFQSGGTPSKANPAYFGGDIPWITTVALNGRKIGAEDAVEWITEKAIQESAAKVVPEGSIMVGTRVGIGKVAVNTVPMSTSQDIISLVGIDPQYWNKEYLCRFIQSRSAFLNAKARGATIKGIKIEALASLELPDVLLQQQHEIIDILNHISEMITFRQRQLFALDTLIKARFVEMFGDPVSNSFGWQQTVLNTVTSKIGSGATPKGGKESYQTEGITLIRSMNVHDGRFEYKDLAHITNEQARQLDNVTVEENDVFINITGASVARSCIVPVDILPARVNQHVAIVRCIQDNIHPVFINNMFLNGRFKRQLLDIGESGGATRQAITKQQLESLVIILPPIKLQKQFASFVSQIDKSKSLVQKALDEAQLLFDSLMQQYFG